MPASAERPEHDLDLGARALVELAEHRPAFVGQREKTPAPIAAAAASRYQLPLPESAKDPAQIPGIDSKLAADLGGGGLFAVGQLVENADLGKREGALQMSGAEDPDAAGVEPVEAADGGNGRRAWQAVRIVIFAKVNYILASVKYRSAYVTSHSPVQLPASHDWI